MTPALVVAVLLAAPTAAVTPARARPGDVVLVTVRGEEGPVGSLEGRALHFFEAGPGRWLALAAVPIETTPGTAALRLSGEEALELEVEPPGFRSTTLTVAPRFLDPPAAARKRIAADGAALKQAYAQPFEPPLFAAPFVRPREAEVSSRFGDQRVYNGKTSGVHLGLDLVGKSGDAIEASGDGRVVMVRDCYQSGWTTVIWHGAGVYSVYLHQSRVEVKAGQGVSRGQRIGRVGSTGRSTGPHLHWGVRVDGLWVDPESILRLDLGSDAMATSAPTSTSTPPPPPP